jgi:hypothetical protein
VRCRVARMGLHRHFAHAGGVTVQGPDHQATDKSMNASLRSAALLCVSLSFDVAYGQSSLIVDRTFAHTLTPAQLKRAYLACDQASLTARLSIHDAIQCSIVHEELKQRVFGGDFDQLLTWWKAQRRNATGRAATGAAP